METTVPASALTLSLGELVEAETALARLLEERLPVKLAYQVARLTRCVRAETKFFTDTRDALIRELGAPSAPNEAERSAGLTEIIRVKPEHTAEFNRRIMELVAVPVTLTRSPLDLTALIEAGVSLSGGDLLRLGALLNEETSCPT